MKTALVFEVPGDPVPKARARVVKGRAFTPRQTRAYQRTVMIRALAARQAVVVASRQPWPLGGTYRVEVEYARSTEHAHDCDNVLKAIQDGLSTVLFDDDRQVWEAEIKRRRSSERAVGATVRVIVLSTPQPVAPRVPAPSKRPAARAHPWKAKNFVPKAQP